MGTEPRETTEGAAARARQQAQASAQASMEGAAQRPFDPLMPEVVELHETFLRFRAGGFTEHQACTIIGVWFATLGKGGTGESPA